MLYSSVPCAEPEWSDVVVLNVPPVLPVSVTIDATSEEVCEQTQVTFTAYPVNEGPAPAYQWKKNSVDISGATLSTYSYTPVNGDMIACVLTSSAICVSGNPATSNVITMIVNPLLPVSVTIQTGQSEVCQGTEVVFTSDVTNGGTQPTYQWQVNSTDIAGATNATFSYTPANGNQISCLVTSDEACTTGNPAISNTISMVVNPLLPVSASIAASANPVFLGMEVTFNASVVNGGTNPVFAWFVNNLPVGSNSSVFVYPPQDGDEVKCVVTSDAQCASGSPATSNTIAMEVNVLPFSLHIQNMVLFNGETRCFNAWNTIIVAGGSSTFLMTPGSSATIISGQRVIFRPGTKVMAGAYMHAYISTTFCGGYIPPMPGLLAGQDEEVNMVAERPSFRIFPNPTSAGFTIEQRELLSSADFRYEIYSITGERVRTDAVIGAQRHVVDFMDQPAGLYIVKIIAGDYVETIKLVKNR
jgi:hypothetical protein